jgi:hypothetical protein
LSCEKSQSSDFHLSILERIIRNGIDICPNYGTWNWAMYKSYMDESGVNDPQALAIAGYFGPDTQLDRLAREWESVLAEYGMQDCGFHAREFYNPAPSSQVYNWSQAKRQQFIDELLKVVEDRRIWLFATGVDVDAFNRLTEGERRLLTGGVFIGPSGKWKSLSGKPSAPYFVALRSILETIAVRTVRGQKCYQILHWQEQYEGYAYQYYEWMTGPKSPMSLKYDVSRFGHPLVFGKTSQYLQLQAADLAAYHIYNFVLEKRLNPDLKSTAIVRRLARKAQSFSDLKMVTADALPKLLNAYREYEPFWDDERKRRAAKHGR